MDFIPISVDDYVRDFLKNNPGANEADLRMRLRAALHRFRAGATCFCGQPIWVIGSAEAGDMCFTCITGSSDSSEDYELAGALGSPRAGTSLP